MSLHLLGGCFTFLYLHIKLVNQAHARCEREMTAVIILSKWSTLHRNKKLSVQWADVASNISYWL